MIVDEMLETLCKLKIAEPLKVHSIAISYYYNWGLNFDNYWEKRYVDRRVDGCTVQTRAYR